MKTELKYTYLHDTHTMYQDNGELHLVNDTQCIVINCDTFYNDLPHLIRLVTEGRNERTELTKESLKQTLKEL